MVTKFGGQILATKFGFVPDCSLQPSDTIWQQRPWTKLALVRAYCLMAPSHCLSQCWQISSGVLWHSPKSNFTVSTQATNLYNDFQNYDFKTFATSLRGQWVNGIHKQALNWLLDKISTQYTCICWNWNSLKAILQCHSLNQEVRITDLAIQILPKQIKLLQS